MFAGEALSREKAERISKFYFYGGFVGLPWLWVVNYFYLRRFADESDIIATYVRRSLWCGVVGCLCLLVWIVIAQTALASNSGLWIIAPSASGAWQSGFFADAVYQNT